MENLKIFLGIMYLTAQILCITLKKENYMCEKTINVYEFMRHFPNVGVAMQWLENRRWKDGGKFPYCTSECTTRLSDKQYHQFNHKHLHRYLGEFSLRLNQRNALQHTMDRILSICDHIVGNRLTYKRFTS